MLQILNLFLDIFLQVHNLLRFIGQLNFNFTLILLDILELLEQRIRRGGVEDTIEFVLYVGLHTFNDYLLLWGKVFYQIISINKRQMNSALKYREGDWHCLLCHNFNYSFRQHCNRCREITKEQNEHQNNLMAYNLKPIFTPLRKKIHEEVDAIEGLISVSPIIRQLDI